MTAHPLVPAFDGASVAVGDWLDAQVGLLRQAHRAGDPVAARVLGATGEQAPAGELPVDAARRAVARDHRYPDWAAARDCAHERVDLGFEAAADAVQWGDAAGLRALLADRPELARARSPFPHHATLLHHVAANGIEAERQLQSPPNAAEIARLLLEHGAEPDALCDTYTGGSDQTALCLLVSSSVPADAGVQAALVHVLCAAGAAVDGLDDDARPLWTAVVFGYTEAAQALRRCGAWVDNLVLAAALGDLDQVRAHLGDPRPPTPPPWLPLRPDRTLEYALIWAAAHGRREVVELLLGAGPDLSTAEPCFGGTPLAAARHQGHHDIAALLEQAGA